MRKWLGIALASVLVLGAAEARAAALGFTGQLVLGIGNFPAVTAVGSGTASVTADGGFHLLSLGVPGGTFGPITASLPATADATVQSVRFTAAQNLAGNFTNLSGGPPGGGPMGLAGLARLCLVFDPTCSGIFVPPLPLTPMAGVGFGVGGTQLVSGAVELTLQHAPWSVGSPFVTIHNPGSTVSTPTVPIGFAHGPASGTSSTAQLSGTLRLVTVTRVLTSLTGTLPELPVFGRLTLHFVPEPGTLLLLGSAALGAALLGRGRHPR